MDIKSGEFKNIKTVQHFYLPLKFISYDSKYAIYSKQGKQYNKYTR